jgi:DNA polymerase
VNVLDALGGKSDALVRLDWETYFDKDYTLRKLTTEAYVRDPRFETLGVSVKLGNQPTVWLEDWEFREWAAQVDWSRVTACAHHAHFDGLVAAHRYGICPRFWLDTMSMARALHGPFNVALEKLAVKYGIGLKGKELDNAKGKRRRDFTQAQWEALGGYANNDVDLMDALLWRMLPGFPPEELWLIDSTIRWFTEPVFRADFAVLTKALEEERQKKRAVLTRQAHLPDGALEQRSRRPEQRWHQGQIRRSAPLHGRAAPHEAGQAGADLRVRKDRSGHANAARAQASRSSHWLKRGLR